MKTDFTVTVSLIEGMHFHGRNPAGLGVEMDSKPAGEPIAGASPMEILLQTAGGCSAMDAVSILRKRKLEPEEFEVQVDGVKREEHPRIFKSLTLIYRAKGPGLTIDELQRAAGLSFERYCAVLGMLKAAADVSMKCELLD